MAGDTYGTAVEVLPKNSVWVPGAIEAEIKSAAAMPTYAPVHAALSTPASRATVEAIGRREGWLVRYCDRGPFQVIELWIENTLMFELIPQEMTANYLTFMQPAAYTAFLHAVSESDNSFSRQQSGNALLLTAVSQASRISMAMGAARATNRFCMQLWGATLSGESRSGNPVAFPGISRNSR